MSLRVLHVYFHLGMGGIENYLVRLPDYLPSDIQLFYFLAQERGALAHEAERKGVQILPVPSPPPKWMPEYIYFLLPLARAIKVVKPDIIHAHFENLYVIAMIARFLARSKAAFIAHRHSRPYLAKRSFLWKLHKLLLPRAELILCVSDFVRQANIDFYHLPPEKTRVHYCGIPLEPFQELPEKESSRAQLGLEKDVPIVVFMGRLIIHIKGLDILLQAAAKLVEGGEEFVLLLVGPGEEAREQLQQQAEDLGISDRVRFTGPMVYPALLVALRAGDVFVQPSRWEGFGLSLVEAQAAGLPVIATKVGGIPEAMWEGESGLLVPPEDPEALAEALGWMLAHPEARERMGQAGRRFVFERFDMRVTAAQLAEIYRELASGQKS